MLHVHVIVWRFELPKAKQNHWDAPQLCLDLSMDVSLPLPWRCLPHGAVGVCPSRPRTSRWAYGDWQRQASTVSGTLAALLQSLRRATLGERHRRLRSATLVQLRIISAGLRLRMSDSRPVLVQRIEEKRKRGKLEHLTFDIETIWRQSGDNLETWNQRQSSPENDPCVGCLGRRWSEGTATAGARDPQPTISWEKEPEVPEDDRWEAQRCRAEKPPRRAWNILEHLGTLQQGPKFSHKDPGIFWDQVVDFWDQFIWIQIFFWIACYIQTAWFCQAFVVCCVSAQLAGRCGSGMGQNYHHPKMDGDMQCTNWPIWSFQTGLKP